MSSISRSIARKAREQRRIVFPTHVQRANGKQLQVFNKGTHNFSVAFLKAMKAELDDPKRIKTPVHQSALLPTRERKLNDAKQFVEKKMLKSVVGKRDTYQTVDVYYKVEKKDAESDTWKLATFPPTTYKLSVPVINKLTECSNGRRNKTLLYKFVTSRLEDGEPVCNYKQFQAFLRSVEPSMSKCRSLKKEINKKKRKPRKLICAERKKEHPDKALLDTLELKLGRYDVILKTTQKRGRSLKPDIEKKNKELHKLIRAERKKKIPDKAQLDLLKLSLGRNDVILADAEKAGTMTTSATILSQLKDLIKNTDEAMTSASEDASGWKLTGIEIVLRSGETVATGTSIVGGGDIPQANERQAKFFTSKAIGNDITLEYDFPPKVFEHRTGNEYRPNSCLATCVLYGMFRDNEASNEAPRPKWIQGVKVKVNTLPKWRIAKIKEMYGVESQDLSYELISKICSVPFMPDGSLVLKFKEMELFFSLYAQPIMVQNPLGRKMYSYEPKLYNLEVPRPVIMLVSHHNHCRLVGDSQKELQAFQYNFKNEKEDLCTELENTCRYTIRKEFDCPLMVLNQKDDCTVQDIAETLVRTILEQNEKHEDELRAKEEEATAVTAKGKKQRGGQRKRRKEEFMAQKYVRIHFVGETERLLLALKDNHNIIGGNLKIGQANTIKSFDIRHRKTLMCVGNLALKEELALAVDEINVQTVITNIEHLQKFNEWYGKIYKTLYTEAHLSKYGESFVDIAWGLRCEPLGFSTKSKTPCIGSVDVNKAYTHLLANEMKQVPVFDNFCVFTEFAWDGVVEKLDDHTLYVVKRIEGKKYSTAKSIILDKSHNMYYGKILKEAVSLVRTLEFEVLSRCEPISVVSADFSAGVKELYDKERGLNVVQKKFLVNCIMGCLDQFRRTTRTAEFYETESEAFANNKEDYFKPTVLSVPGEAWADKDSMQRDGGCLLAQGTRVRIASKLVD